MRAQLQTSIALTTIGAITYGILYGYSGFYKQVITYHFIFYVCTYLHFFKLFNNPLKPN